MSAAERSDQERFFRRIRGVNCFAWTTADGRRNFGDEIGPLLVDELLRQRLVATGETERRLFSVGSVLHFASDNDVVWGSGLNGKIHRQATPTTLDVRSVRGPLTRAFLLQRGIRVPQIFGDPALLLPDVFPELAEVPRGDETIIIPNLNDLDRFAVDGRVVSPLDDPMDVIRTIAGAGMVIASSLHALVVADALGVPSRGIRSSAEHPFKYIDYYAGTGRPRTVLADDLAHALFLGPVELPAGDHTALREAFPWDLWGRDIDRFREADEPSSYADFQRSAHAQKVAHLESVGWEVPQDQSDALTRLEQLTTPRPTDGITREEAGLFGIALSHANSWATHPETMLSVVIPTHNVAPWVRETLQSVLAQGVSGMEIVVVDDHSTDGTKTILQEIAQNDPRVRVIDSISRGGGSARNIGVDHARGKYLIFCDGDDLVPEGAYQALVASLEASGSDIAIGDYLKFRPVDVWRPTGTMAAYNRTSVRTSIVREPTLMYSRPCWNKAFSRGFWESRRLRFPDVPRSNDIVPMTRAYLLARAVDVIDDVVYLYRERPGRSSMTASAASAASVVSYFSQEAECAQLVTAAHNPGLTSVYRRLVYDRDGFIHLAKYLVARDSAVEPPQALTDALARISSLVHPPDDGSGRLNPLKGWTFAFAVAGDFVAAAACATLAGVAPSTTAEQLDAMARLLTALESDRGLSEDDRQWLAHRVQALLDDASPTTADGREQGDAVAQLARAFFAEDVLWAIPELADAAIGRSDIGSHTSRNAMITSVTGGRRLRLNGTASDESGAAVPVLYAPRSEVVEPRRFAWHRSGDEFVWEAVFDARSLPLRALMTPVLRAPDGSLMGMRSLTGLPHYVARDDFLYEQAGQRLLVERRRHWTLRAARRAAVIIRNRAMRPFARGRGHE